MKYGVLLFHTFSSALRAEKVLLRGGLVIKLIPTPREFSSDCGIALRCAAENLAQAKTLLEQARVEIAGVGMQQT